MRSSRLALAHILALGSISAFGLIGCAESHGRDPREDDAGLRDAGPAPTVDAGVWHDAGALRDAGPRGECDPEDAREVLCAELLCDGPPSWHWDGTECVPIECGACVGADCADAVRSREDCLATHAACDGALCEATGGDWLWWAEECDHFWCGLPSPADCVVGRPVCDCGYTRRFEPGVGCVPAECPEVDPLPPEDLCRATGGEWGMFCAHSQCGERSLLACALPACHCPGITQVFDAVRGCVEGTRCFERNPGERCHPRARCSGGTICCDGCGAPGCPSEPTCTAPVCDDDPTTDLCGN